MGASWALAGRVNEQFHNVLYITLRRHDKLPLMVLCVLVGAGFALCSVLVIGWYTWKDLYFNGPFLALLHLVCSGLCMIDGLECMGRKDM